MKQFACGELVPGCDAKFQSESEAELFDQIRERIQER